LNDSEGEFKNNMFRNSKATIAAFIGINAKQNGHNPGKRRVDIWKSTTSETRASLRSG